MTQAYPQSVIDRFWSKVDMRGPDECWPWTAGCFDSGYGAFSTTHEKTERAHRVAFKISKGRIGRGKVVRHSCDFKPCCNPKHLLKGTQLQNVKDRDNRGRQAKGESVSKLTTENVIAILADPREQRQIAKDYGVCKSTIGNIKRKDYWKHIHLSTDAIAAARTELGGR